MGKPLEQQTRADQTRYLSREFIIGFAFNVIVVLGGGFYAVGRIEAKADSQVEPQKVTELQAQVAVLESNQIDGDRVTRLETAMIALEKSVIRLQDTLDREAERRR